MSQAIAKVGRVQIGAIKARVQIVLSTVRLDLLSLHVKQGAQEADALPALARALLRGIAQA